MLMDDFQSRCAYSLVHVSVISQGEMHVDHHNPHLKAMSPYENLFPAYGLCNKAKGETWPGAEEDERGARFLNPCIETDYGEQIFEDPITHALIGDNVAARYHIDMLDLNNEALVAQRAERADLAMIFSGQVVLKTQNSLQDALVVRAARRLLNSLEFKIPPIPPPP